MKKILTRLRNLCILIIVIVPIILPFLLPAMYDWWAIINTFILFGNIGIGTVAAMFTYITLNKLLQ